MTTGGGRRIAVVGGSLAGVRVASVLRTEGYSGDLTIIGAEDETYDRPPLSKTYLSGEHGPAQLRLRGREVEADWMLGVTATGLDLDGQCVETDRDERVPFDAVVIATGSSPRRLPDFPVDGSRVVELRTLRDAQRLKAALRSGSRVVIIGSGFIGIELASTCSTLGCRVDLVAPEPPLARMGELVSAFASDLCASHGVTVRKRVALGVEHRDDSVEVLLDSGTSLSADIVIVAVGATPNVEWLRSAGLHDAAGVSCDGFGYVDGLSNVLAAGDVCTWPGPGGRQIRVEHWSNAIEQGTIVARQLLHGRGDGEPPVRVPSAWSDHFGTRMQSIGYPGLAEEAEIVEGSVADGRFGAAMYREGELVAAVGYGVPAVIAGFRGRLASQFSRTR